MSMSTNQTFTIGKHDPIFIEANEGFVEATLITFDSMLVILVIIVLILDNKNLLLLYKKDAKLN